MPQPVYILPLNSPAATLETVGGKGASLSRLAQAGFSVPPGFHVTTAAYRRFVEANGLQPRILDLTPVPVADPAALEVASEAIRVLFLAAPIPDEIANAIHDAYADLSGPVAVRSSATAEDLPGASFAGQQDTYLNIVGAERVLDAVRRCWASLWTARAMGYRAHNAIGPEGVSLAVVVQALIPAEAAGILFTANPITGHRGQAVIDGAWGLGEAVVGGLVTPDHWVVDKASGRIVTAEVHDKAVMTVRTAEGTEEVPTPDDQRRLPVLSEDQVQALTATATRIEALYGAPQDIEWALADGQLYILQSRPITSLYPQPSPRPTDGQLHVYANFNYLQGLVEPLTPAGLSMFLELVRYVGRLTGQRLVEENGQPGIAMPVGGRLFVDVTTPLRSPRALGVVKAVTALMDPRMGHAVSEVLADPRLTPRPDRPLSASIERFRPLLRVAPVILSRVLRLWANPDRARRQLMLDYHHRVAQLHDEIDRARTLAERAAVLDNVPRLAGFLFPRLLPLAMSGIALQRLSHSYIERWLGDTTTSLELLRGVPHNPTTTMGLSLWSLSQSVAVDPASVASLRRPTEQVTADYQAKRLPPTLQAALGSFLAVYGHRSIREIDIGMPRWSEAPGYIIDVLRTYLDITDPALAPDLHFREGDAAARRSLEGLLDRVAALPQGGIKRRALGAMLRRMRDLMGLREMPKFILIRAFAEIRRLWWAMGEDLVKLGLLDNAEAAFFLTADELRAVARGQREPLTGRAADRRDAYQAEMRRKRVPRLITSEGVELYGALTVKDGAALEGTGASPGVVEGVVRVILDPHGAQLEPGEILVAPSTDPAWTPLFLAAGGLVMEAGGMMSHGSVVAREYGIPAVVGVTDATHLLRTGERVTVDGTAGRVIKDEGLKTED
ncbi:MAG: phosphoenolpyruvate synthase [Anaerolineae bacterium]|nr:phosphoenolpyruvate synthase [Anaerolineae bacterium]